MATITRFEDMVVWQKARLLCQLVFEVMNYPAFSKDFQLRNQINRSSGSVMDNIAEGFGRNGNAEFCNFLTIANGSVQEVSSQVYRANDRNYISEAKMFELHQLIGEISKMIFGWIIIFSAS